MAGKHIAFGLAAVILAAAGTARAEGAASPADIVKHFEKAAKAGDINAILALLTDDVSAAFKKIVAMADAQAALNKASKDKFGSDLLPGRGDPKAELLSYESIELVKEEADGDNKAKLSVKSTKKGGATKEETWFAEKTSDGWKFRPDKLDAKFLSQVGAITAMTDVLKKYTADIAAGKYADLNSARQALVTEIQAVLQTAAIKKDEKKSE